MSFGTGTVLLDVREYRTDRDPIVVPDECLRGSAGVRGLVGSDDRSRSVACQESRASQPMSSRLIVATGRLTQSAKITHSPPASRVPLPDRPHRLVVNGEPAPHRIPATIPTNLPRNAGVIAHRWIVFFPHVDQLRFQRVMKRAGSSGHHSHRHTFEGSTHELSKDSESDTGRASRISGRVLVATRQPADSPGLAELGTSIGVAAAAGLA